MFENLDDPQPPSAAPIDGVTARGRQLRKQRRLIAGAVVTFVLAGTIATAAALQGDGHDKVIVSNQPSTTITSDTTVPGGTSTTAPDTTTSVTPTTNAVVAPTSTTTTQPPHDSNDLSMVSVIWPAEDQGDFGNCLGGVPVCHNSREIFTGESAPVNYTVTNNGSWTVHLAECDFHTVDVWADNTAGGFGQYDQVWPAPYPARGVEKPVCAAVLGTLAPGARVALTETISAGYGNAAGDVMPSSPGATSFTPSFLPQCAQPCKTFSPDALMLRVVPPVEAQVPYTIAVKTMHPTSASATSTKVEMSYTNPLAFTVRTPLFGPCWTVKTGPASVDCSGPLPALIIGPHQTVVLVGNLWARKGFVATGAPLAPGKYAVNLGDRYGGVADPPDPQASFLTVTP